MATIESIYNLYRRYPVITTDTRTCTPGSLFFALKGEKFNANAFAAQALEKGAEYAIVDDPEYAITDRYILVDDVLSCLQQLAALHRSQLNIPVIGITGTNGKTTTKELTYEVLSSRFKTLATEGNLNNHIGVPLTLLKIRPEHEIAIIEMGANHPGEIEFLCNIAKPDFGLITNVGKAHLEGFGSFEGVIKTKSELYDSLRKTGGKAFVDAGNPYLMPLTKGLDTILYTTDAAVVNERKDKILVSGELTDCDPCVGFNLIFENKKYPIQTRLIGTYNMPNLLAAAAFGIHFGLSPEDVRDTLNGYASSNKRSQLIKTQSNTLILDAYNANPTSMNAALLNFKELKADKKTIILGGMRELGKESELEHKHILDLIIASGFESVILVGEEFNALPHPFLKFDTTADLKEWLVNHPFSDQTILIKGSRGIALESIIDSL